MCIFLFCQTFRAKAPEFLGYHSGVPSANTIVGTLTPRVQIERVQTHKNRGFEGLKEADFYAPRYAYSEKRLDLVGNDGYANVPAWVRTFASDATATANL